MATPPKLDVLVNQLVQRIEALESRNAFQDDVIEQLNIELAVHQEEIAVLKQQLQFMASRVKDMQVSPIAKEQDETPPPHY